MPHQHVWVSHMVGHKIPTQFKTQQIALHGDCISLSPIHGEG